MYRLRTPYSVPLLTPNFPSLHRPSRTFHPSTIAFDLKEDIARTSIRCLAEHTRYFIASSFSFLFFSFQPNANSVVYSERLLLVLCLRADAWPFVQTSYSGQPPINVHLEQSLLPSTVISDLNISATRSEDLVASSSSTCADRRITMTA